MLYEVITGDECGGNKYCSAGGSRGLAGAGVQVLSPDCCHVLLRMGWNICRYLLGASPVSRLKRRRITSYNVCYTKLLRETVRSVRSLEGWAWASGDIRCQHEVVGVTEKGGHTIVQVRSQGTTATEAVKGTTGFVGTGTLTRRIDWSFNIDTGQLLSPSLQQEGNGTNQLPQGQMKVRRNNFV